jgi:hypothetical protein
MLLPPGMMTGESKGRSRSRECQDGEVKLVNPKLSPVVEPMQAGWSYAHGTETIHTQKGLIQLSRLEIQLFSKS